MKLCQIYNFPSHYRLPIYRLISETFESTFFFGSKPIRIKQFNEKELPAKVMITPYREWKGFSYQTGILTQLFKKYDAYLVTGETRNVSIWLLLLLSRLIPHKRVYVWSHGWYGKESAFERLLKKVFFSLPKGGVFLYGNYARNLMIKEGFNAEKLYVIHNSLNYNQHKKLREKLGQTAIYSQHFNNSYPNLVFIGRLTAVKQLDLLLEAIHLNKKRGNYYNVTFIGDGNEYQRLRSIAEEYEISDQVWFYGACYDEEENANLIYNADLCVSPGNVGLTAIHCMTFGTPVITHNRFELQMPEFEAIEAGSSGDFFEYGNAVSLANAIDKWFDEHKDRETIRRSCMQIIDESWNPYYQVKVLKEHLTIINEVSD